MSADACSLGAQRQRQLEAEQAASPYSTVEKVGGRCRAGRGALCSQWQLPGRLGPNLWGACVSTRAWQGIRQFGNLKALTLHTYTIHSFASFSSPPLSRTAWLLQRWMKQRALLPSRPWRARRTLRAKSERCRLRLRLAAWQDARCMGGC